MVIPDNFIDRAIHAWIRVRDEDWTNWILNTDTICYESTKVYVVKPEDMTKRFFFKITRCIPKDSFEVDYSIDEKLNYLYPIRLNRIGVQLVDRRSRKTIFRVGHLGVHHEEMIEITEFNKEERDRVIIA